MACTPRWSRFPAMPAAPQILGAPAPVHSYGVVRRLCGCVDAQRGRRGAGRRSGSHARCRSRRLSPLVARRSLPGRCAIRSDRPGRAVTGIATLAVRGEGDDADALRVMLAFLPASSHAIGVRAAAGPCECQEIPTR